MRAVIIEPFNAGHRASYVGWIGRAFHKAGVDVAVVGGKELIARPEVKQELETSVDANRRGAGIAVDIPPATPRGYGMLDLWRFELRMRDWFGNAYACAQPRPKDDIVVVPFLDYCFHAVAALGSPFGSAPWCGITMRTEFAEHSNGENMRLAMRHVLLRRLLSAHTTRAVFSIDPRSEAEIGRRAGDWRYTKLRYLPDPAELDLLPDRETARRELGIGASQKTLLLFGSIDLRKGLEELLRGVAATTTPSEWTVLIAGKQTEPAARLLADWQSTKDRSPLLLQVLDGVVASADVPRLFAAADVVWIGYPQHAAMSGVLVQAAMAGKPVIAQAGSLLGKIVTRTQIGVVCDVANAVSVAAALTGASSLEAVQAAVQLGPKNFAMHTPQEFGARIVAASEPVQRKVAA